MDSEFASWGGGSCECEPNCNCKCPKDRPRDSIYMASNTADSTSVYDALICIEPLPVHHNAPGVGDGDFGGLGLTQKGTVCPVNAHGDIEHLRETLAGRETHLLPDAIYWMTDRTPHESLPLQAGTLRQYFRLVTSKVSLWYAEHSTANPKVPLPEGITLIEGNKFSAYHTV